MREQNNFEALADTLLGSNDILSEANDQCAAGMYRAIFRHGVWVLKNTLKSVTEDLKVRSCK